MVLIMPDLRCGEVGDVLPLLPVPEYQHLGGGQALELVPRAAGHHQDLVQHSDNLSTKQQESVLTAWDSLT